MMLIKIETPVFMQHKKKNILFKRKSNIYHGLKEVISIVASFS